MSTPLPASVTDAERLFDLSPDLLCVSSLDGRYLRVNAAFTRLLGWSREELLSRPFNDFVHPDDRDRVAAVVGTLREGEPALSVENRLLCADGSSRWIAWTSYPVPAEDVTYSVGRDVTEQRATLAALRDSEERYRTLTEVSPQIVWMADTQGRVTYANQHWLDYSGQTLEEATEDWAAVIDAAHRPRILAAWQEAVAAGTEWLAEIPFRRASDGMPRWHLAHGVPLRDAAGRIERWVGVATDIHDRKVAEEIVARQAALLDQAEDAIFAWEWDGPIVTWNRGAEHLYGYTAAEAIGRLSHDLLRTVAPQALRDLLRRLREVGEWEGDLVHTTKSGVQLTVSSRWQVVREGEQVLVLEANRDATARREADEQRDLFVRAVVHDVRNPAAAILMHAQLLERQAAHGSLDGEALNFAVRGIEAAVGRLSRRLEELADVATAQGSGRSLRFADTDLTALATRSAEAHRATAERHRIEVVAPLPVVGNWDASRLERIVDNLLGNAIKYSPNGGTVTVEVRREGDWGILRVADEGIGIPPEEQRGIFRQFRRGPNVGRITGSGIGLASVAQVVAAHHGMVEVESEVGRGSVFTVRLPIDPAAD